MPLPSPEAYLDVLVDEDILDMIDDFLHNQRAEVEKLRQAMANGDRDSCRRIGHTMKGVGGMYGFHWLSLVALEIEHASKEDPTQLPPLVEMLAGYLERVQYRPG